MRGAVQDRRLEVVAGPPLAALREPGEIAPTLYSDRSVPPEPTRHSD